MFFALNHQTFRSLLYSGVKTIRGLAPAKLQIIRNFKAIIIDSGLLGHYFALRLSRLQIPDLNDITKSDKLLGWCRGIHVLGNDKVLIGFHEFRRVIFVEIGDESRIRLGFVKVPEFWVLE